MLFSILNIFITVIIVVLFVRFFVERYQFYGFGPIMVSVIRVSEMIIRPVKDILPRGALALRDHLPLVAIVVVLVIRGFFIWIFGPGFTYPFRFTNNITLINAMAISLTMGVLLLGEMLIAFLFASFMISRRGINMYGNGAFVCFKEKTFTIFNFTRKFVKTDNLTWLFLISSGAILLMTSVLTGFTNLSFLMGGRAYQISLLIAFFEIISVLMNLYFIVLILAILSTWIGADQYSAALQIIRSMSDPYLDIFRRLFPWARIDFIDLSPIFAFILLNPIGTYILASIKFSLLQMIISQGAQGIPAIPPEDGGIRI